MIFEKKKRKENKTRTIGWCRAKGQRNGNAKGSSAAEQTTTQTRKKDKRNRRHEKVVSFGKLHAFLHISRGGCLLAFCACRLVVRNGDRMSKVVITELPRQTFSPQKEDGSCQILGQIVNQVRYAAASRNAIQSVSYSSTRVTDNTFELDVVHGVGGCRCNYIKTQEKNASPFTYRQQSSAWKT